MTFVPSCSGMYYVTHRAPWTRCPLKVSHSSSVSKESDCQAWFCDSSAELLWYFPVRYKTSRGLGEDDCPVKLLLQETGLFFGFVFRGLKFRIIFASFLILISSVVSSWSRKWESRMLVPEIAFSCWPEKRSRPSTVWLEIVAHNFQCLPNWRKQSNCLDQLNFHDNSVGAFVAGEGHKACKHGPIFSKRLFPGLHPWMRWSSFALLFAFEMGRSLWHNQHNHNHYCVLINPRTTQNEKQNR